MEPLFENDKTSIMYISKSQVFSFDFCPMQFYYNYIEKIKQPETLAMQIGTRIHEFAEKFMEVCEDLDINEWDSTIPEEFIPLEKQLAKNIIDFEKARYMDAIVRGEERLFSPYAMELSCSSDNLRIRGFIDRIDWVDPENKKVRLVEIKTGNVKQSKVLQELAFYKILFEDQYPDFEVVEYAIYAPKLNSFDYFKPTKREMNLMLKKWEALKTALKTGEYIAKENEIKCGFCGYCDGIES